MGSYILIIKNKFQLYEKAFASLLIRLQTSEKVFSFHPFFKLTRKRISEINIFLFFCLIKSAFMLK
ncbi:hypothetical protein AZ46_0202395 [Metabacillus indicus LMG 22858]|nr:hypothetical protein AZ46_0202395 [Metabacillus indicus LMG 22858]